MATHFWANITNSMTKLLDHLNWLSPRPTGWWQDDQGQVWIEFESPEDAEEFRNLVAYDDPGDPVGCQVGHPADHVNNHGSERAPDRDEVPVESLWSPDQPLEDELAAEQALHGFVHFPEHQLPVVCDRMWGAIMDIYG